MMNRQTNQQAGKRKPPVLEYGRKEH